MAYLAAWLAFAVALARRRRTWPGALRWMGRVSYSIYLVHMVVYFASGWLVANLVSLPTGSVGRLAVFAVQLAIILAISQWTYRWIEQPGQRLGRRVGQIVTAR